MKTGENSGQRVRGQQTLARNSTLRFGEAWDALRGLLRSPDDTEQAFRVADALAGRSPERLLRRMKGSVAGARLLGERTNLMDALGDRAALEAMPQGSLAHAYLGFLEGEGITAAGLIDASLAGRTEARSEEHGWLGDHLRDQHDLWHAVTGYQGDLLGESALLAFTFAQTHNPGIGALVILALAHTFSLKGQRLILGGLARGMRASWLPEQDWVSLLPLPLAEVRRRLGVGQPPEYEPFRSSELPPEGVTLRTALEASAQAS